MSDKKYKCGNCGGDYHGPLCGGMFVERSEDTRRIESIRDRPTDPVPVMLTREQAEWLSEFVADFAPANADVRAALRAALSGGRRTWKMWADRPITDKDARIELWNCQRKDVDGRPVLVVEIPE